MSNRPCMTIQATEEFTDCAKIVAIYGQGCNHPTGYGVEGFHVDYDVLINNGSEERTFHIVMQQLDRSDSIMAYNGVEMTSAGKYGVDADQTAEAFEFIKENDELDAELMIQGIVNDAQNRCRHWFINHIANLLDPLYADSDDDGVDDLSLCLAIIDEIKKCDDLALFDERQIKEVVFDECEKALKAQVFAIDDDIDDYQFNVYDNDYGYENLVDRATFLMERAYEDMGETGLSDDDIKANLDDTDLVFVNLYERALNATEDMNGDQVATDKQVYISFYSQLWQLVHGTETTVNVWHIEQNEIQPVEQRESVKSLCYAQVANIVNAAKT